MGRSVFLFGAGASYGSDTQGTPPLGAKLFDELRRFNPDGWGFLHEDIARKFREDFERALQTLDQHALAPLQRAMAAYFFRFRPGPSNLYRELSRRIGRVGWSGVLCTLNYERLLEISLLENGIQYHYANRPGNGKGVELCFPHGCCHIFCEGAKGMAGGVSFAGLSVHTDGPVSFITEPAAHWERLTQDAFPPVMSYFEPGKRTTSGHSFIVGQRERWKQSVASAESVAVVGARVRPHDAHIWDPLAGTPAHITYCGGPTGAEEFRAWAKLSRAGRQDTVLQGYLCDEFDAICNAVGL